MVPYPFIFGSWPNRVKPKEGSERLHMKASRSLYAWLFVTGIVLGPPLLMAFDVKHRLYWGILGLLSNGLLFYSAVRSNCTWFGPVVTRFATERKDVWLTIDDGPDPHDTPKLLELLERHDAKATFFVIGDRVRLYPELARKVLAAGHQLANHSGTHPAATFWCLPESSLAHQVDNGRRAIFENTGQSWSYFRAPAGMANIFLHLVLRRRSLKLIGWSARGYDGIRKEPDLIVADILRSVRPGTIILVHEGKRDRHGNPLNLAVIEALLLRLKSSGYSFTVPSEDRLR